MIGVHKIKELGVMKRDVVYRKAKDFAEEITQFNVQKKGLQGEKQIAEEHVKNSREVRQVLANNNICPKKKST